MPDLAAIIAHILSPKTVDQTASELADAMPASAHYLAKIACETLAEELKRSFGEP